MKGLPLLEHPKFTWSSSETQKPKMPTECQVTQGEESYPLAIQTRRVRQLLGEVMHLPGEQAADGILTVTCHKDMLLSSNAAFQRAEPQLG